MGSVQVSGSLYTLKEAHENEMVDYENLHTVVDQLLGLSLASQKDGVFSVLDLGTTGTSSCNIINKPVLESGSTEGTPAAGLLCTLGGVCQGWDGRTKEQTSAGGFISGCSYEN